MPAGFWIRFGAQLLDGIIVGIPLSIAGMMLFDGRASESFSNFMMFLYTLLIPLLWQGYTVGKRLCGIRIEKTYGGPPGFGTMLLRTLVSNIVYALTLGIAVIVSAFMVGLREDKRAIHDFIAGTHVVHD